MTNQSSTDAILRELAGLPEDRQADVLAFVRFLKTGLTDVETTAHEFDQALERAHKIAERQNLPKMIYRGSAPL